MVSRKLIVLMSLAVLACLALVVGATVGQTSAPAVAPAENAAEEAPSTSVDSAAPGSGPAADSEPAIGVQVQGDQSVSGALPDVAATPPASNRSPAAAEATKPPTPRRRSASISVQPGPAGSGRATVVTRSTGVLTDENVPHDAGTAAEHLQFIVGSRYVAEMDPEKAKLVQEDAQMEVQGRELAVRCRQEKDKQKRADLRKQLAELCSKDFDLRQKARQMDVDRLEAELKKIRAAMEKRTAAREMIVERRVATLLGEEDELGFPPPPGQRGEARGRYGAFRYNGPYAPPATAGYLAPETPLPPDQPSDPFGSSAPGTAPPAPIVPGPPTPPRSR